MLLLPPYLVTCAPTWTYLFPTPTFWSPCLCPYLGLPHPTCHLPSSCTCRPACLPAQLRPHTLAVPHACSAQVPERPHFPVLLRVCNRSAVPDRSPITGQDSALPGRPTLPVATCLYLCLLITPAHALPPCPALPTPTPLGYHACSYPLTCHISLPAALPAHSACHRVCLIYTLCLQVSYSFLPFAFAFGIVRIFHSPVWDRVPPHPSHLSTGVWTRSRAFLPHCVFYAVLLYT